MRILVANNVDKKKRLRYRDCDIEIAIEIAIEITIEITIEVEISLR